MCVPYVDCLSGRISEEDHGSRYSIHLCDTTMYRDLQDVYLWDGLKRDIEDFVAKFLIVNKLRKNVNDRVV